MGYGWSSKQMARVNARREARGQEPLEFNPPSERAASRYAEEYERYGRRRRGVEEEDDETQVVSKTPRLEEYKKMLADREKEKAIAKAPRVLSSPYGTQMGSLA
jgi:hypothetical protein